MTNKSDGSSASYYELPKGCTQLQDLISHRNMNAQDGEIFRAIYRKGRASHSDELRDARKVLFYAQAEVERLEANAPVAWPTEGAHRRNRPERQRRGGALPATADARYVPAGAWRRGGCATGWQRLESDRAQRAGCSSAGRNDRR